MLPKFSLEQAQARWRPRLFALQDKEPRALRALALEIFQYQALHNPTYRDYVRALGAVPEQVQQLSEVPCLPIALYREQLVQTGYWKPEACFQSSGTTQQRPSQHAIEDLSFYEEVSRHIFEQQYGSLSGTLILGLLPDYLARPNSSLIYMLKAFMQHSEHPGSGFFMHEHTALAARIQRAAEAPGPKQLWGLPMALLDFAKRYPKLPLQDFLIIETGGTKQAYSDHAPQDLRTHLQAALAAPALHSEYGMAELLSQAYSRDGCRFVPPPWMRLWARDPEDPLRILPTGEVGGLNIMDLAAMHSCAFVATEDQGRLHPDGSFELLGRMPTAAPRGCHLLYET